jgi:DNA-binding MarR family transcriptional regulator
MDNREKRSQANHLERTINLLGAVAVLTSDAVEASREAHLGRGRASSAGALVALATFGGLTVERLRDALGVSHSGASRVIDRLEQQGWVIRTASAPGVTDGRVVTVSLTREGRRTARRLLALRREALQRLMQPLDPHEQRQLAELLGKIVHGRVSDRDQLRRACRLCDHTVCLPCPALDRVETAEALQAIEAQPAVRKPVSRAQRS